MSTAGHAEPGPARAETSDLSHVHRMWADDRASAALGIELVEVGVTTSDGAPLGRARTRMTVVESMVNGHDILHGGYLFTLADSTFALACNAAGRSTVASGCDITFLSPVRLGEVLEASAHERVTYGRSGITDVTVRRVDAGESVDGEAGDGEPGAAGEVVAEFRGRSRSLR